MTMTTTKVIPNTYNDKPMFSIYKIDDKGEAAAKPVFNCGITKVKYIAEHLEELKKFLEENS